MTTEYDELKKEIEALYSKFLEGELDEWESSFVEEMYRRFEKGRSFSPNQLAKLEEIYDRHFE